MLLKDAKLTADDILNAVIAERNAAIGYQDELGSKRERLLSYYNMLPYGDEIDGRSRYISSDVSDVVEGMTQDLVKLFTQGGKVFEFTANTAETEKESRQKSNKTDIKAK